jgi:hypothetical protein
MSSQNRPCRYPPDGCAAIRNRKGRRFESELRHYHRRLTLTGCAGCNRCFMPAGDVGTPGPLLSINVKRERDGSTWLAMIGRLVTVSATFIHYV